MVRQTRCSLFVGCLVLSLVSLSFVSVTQGQENDPTAKSDVINKTLSKICEGVN